MRFAWHSFLTAIQFLTRVPVPGGMNRPGADPALLRGAVPFFPLVGGLIGAVTAGVIALAGQLWPGPIAVLLGLAVEAILTGAFHEDAVADTCDAFGGGWTREEVLRILQDSRIGSFGAVGLLLAVALRAACLMQPVTTAALIVASAAIGRWAILILMARVPPVPHRDGLAKDIGEQLARWNLLGGTGLMLLASSVWLAGDPGRGAMAVGAVALWAILWGRYVRGRLGGITGDALGAGCYAAQILVLLVGVAP